MIIRLTEGKIIKLTEDGRTDDIVKAAQDEVYQKQLLEEYGLADK